MKAQEKTGTQATQVAVEEKKTKGSAGQTSRPKKRPKMDVKEEPESEGEEGEDEDAKLAPSVTERCS
jgi:hypothetical protein